MKSTNILRLPTISIICILLVTLNACRDGERNEDPPVDSNSSNTAVTTNRDGERDENPPVDPNSTNTTTNSTNTNTNLRPGNNPNPVDPPFTTVKIGNQIWKTRNLNVDKYRNGDPIPQATTKDEWDNLTTGAWCYYNDDPDSGAIYGKLYNWYAVNDSRGLAPLGWHVPTHAEWMTLVTASGPSPTGPLDRAGIYLKQAGTDHWNDPNLADNRTGFTALPGGSRGSPNETTYPGGPNLPYAVIGKTGYFWASDVDTPNPLSGTYLLPWSIYIRYNSGSLWLWPTEKYYGYSVRLIKD